MDSIAELDLLRSIGVSVKLGTRVCGMADSGHRLHVKLGSALLHASIGGRRVFMMSEKDHRPQVRTCQISQKQRERNCTGESLDSEMIDEAVGLTSNLHWSSETALQSICKIIELI